MVDHDDEALARLRASDPATGSHPDLHSLRARIAQKAPASQGVERATRVDDDVFRGQGLRAPWIAAAAVAAFGFGAGGYAIGAQQAPDTGGRQVAAGEGTDDSAAADLVQDMIEPASPAEAAGSELKITEDSEMGYGGDDSGGLWDPGPVRLTAGPGLPTERGTAEVRAMVSDEDPEEFLQQWAERLDFDGVAPAESSEYGWFGSNALYDLDQGRMLSVSADGGGVLSFSYDDMFGSPWCTEMYSEMPEADMQQVREEWAKAFGEDVPFPDASRCRTSDAPRPNDEQALAAARDFFATTGIDLSVFTLEVSEYQDESTNQVMVEGWMDGQRNGPVTMSAQVGPEGVISLYGSWGEMMSLGDYPVISAVEAVERYGQREFSTDYGVTLTEELDDSVAISRPIDPGMDVEMPETAQIEPGMKIPMLLKDKVVVSAELTTGSLWAQTNGPLEVPAWKLVTADGMHYAVLAVADEAIEWQSWGE